MRSSFRGLPLLLLCACSPEATVGTLDEALISPGVPIVVSEFPDGFPIHGVGGDGVLLFAAQPSDAPTRARGVHVSLPGVGPIAEVTPPPGGWGTPLTIKIESFSLEDHELRGRFLLMDNSVPPALAGTKPTLIYRYRYAWSPWSGFSSTLLEAHELPIDTVPPGAGPPDGLVYAGSFALLPDGRVAVTDNLTGALWVPLDATLDAWAIGLIDPTPPPGNRFAGTFGPAIEGVGRAPDGGTRPYTLLVPAPPGSPPGLGLYPGSHSITYAAITDEVCWAVTLPGGIYCTPRASLVGGGDPTTKPVRNLVPPGPESIGTFADGCDYDRFHPSSPWLYWQPAPSNDVNEGVNTLYRVHLTDGRIEVVARSNVAFDWTNEISVLPLPGELHVTAILSSVGQEYNNPDVNVLLGGVSSYVPPSPHPVTVVSW